MMYLQTVTKNAGSKSMSLHPLLWEGKSESQVFLIIA